MSVGIGSVLFFSVVSLSSLDEGHSFVSCKCWMPLGLVNILVFVCIWERCLLLVVLLVGPD